MVCKNCGAEFDDELKICPECDAPVDTEENEAVEEIGENVVSEDLVDESVNESEADETEADDEENDSDEDEDDSDEDEDNDDNKDDNAGKAGLIIAVIAIVLVIAIGSVIFFASKKDYSGTSSLDKFFFSLKSDKSKHYLDGIWKIDNSDYYYEFDGDKANYYNKSNLQQEFSVKYISENEIILSCTTEDGLTFIESMKPILNKEEKTLKFLIYYEKYELSTEAMEDNEMSLSQADALPEPFTLEENMSEENKNALQGTWKGTQATSDSEDDAEETELTIDGETITWESNEWEAVYAEDGELALKMYVEYYGGDCYLGYSYTIKDDTLVLKEKYQIIDGEKTETDEESQTVLTLKKQK